VAHSRHRRLTVAVGGCRGLGPKSRPWRDLGPEPVLRIARRVRGS